MSLTVLGGMAHGTNLKVPPGDFIRPMSVRLKRRIFDSYQDLSGVLFYDACAGSGAVGIEAWSRGAKGVYFSEVSQKVYPYLRSNIEKIEELFPEEVLVRPLNSTQQDCLKYFENFKSMYLSLTKEEQQQTLIFLAPPYAKHQIYENFLTNLKNFKEYIGVIWIESDTQKGPEILQLENWGRPFQKVIKQGTIVLGLTDWEV